MKKWLVLLSLLLLTACMGQGVTYDLNTSLHAVLLSDLHFSVSPNVVSSIVPAMPYSRAFTEALFAEVIAAHPDVLIIDGDNTNSGSREDMEELAKLLSQDSAAVFSIEDMMKDNETLDAQQDNAGQQAVIWLYGSVHKMGNLADALDK